MSNTKVLSLVACVALALPAAPQSNAEPGYDVSLVGLGGLSFRGRTGTWPGGVNAVSMSTTACNVGTVNVPWLAAMNEDHPMIAFMVVAERDGRVVQISDRSYLKHGFTSTNQGGCGNCPGGPGSQLTVGCSDTYGAGTNANNYYLGPPEEVDPWLGTWASVCSHFDRGEPPVPPPFDCDGQRSLTMSQASALGPVGHRMRVPDAEFEHPGNVVLAQQAHYIVRRELEAVRGDNSGWRTFQATWTGNSYNFSTTNDPANGSVVNAWTGATVSSGDGGGFDGRVFVGGLASTRGATHHYEYALHNRDNVGGIDVLRIPLAPGAVVTGAGMIDLDQNSSNDWTATVVGNELVFDGSGNPLPWNVIFNVWFDTDASAATGTVQLTQASGLGDIAVDGLPTPTGALTPPGVAYCTAGTSASGCTAMIAGAGVPSATLSSGFVLSATGVEGLVNGQFFYGANGRQANPWGTSTSYQCVVPPVQRGGTTTGGGTSGLCDGAFAQDLNARWTAQPAQNPGAGATVQAQLWYRDPLSTSNQTTSLSDAYEFTVLP